MISSYKVTGETNNWVNTFDPVCGDSGYYQYKTLYIIDSTKKGAKEQFLVMFPNSKNIHVELIKELFSVGDKTV